MKKIIHNIETGEISEVEMTAEEVALRLQEETKWKAEQAEKAQAEVSVLEARAALLAKLGITEEEARLLLGGN